MPAHRLAILDDYQNVALTLADWSAITSDVDITVFNTPLGSRDNIIRILRGFDMVCLMRERTRFPREIIEALPDLKLIVTTGMRNASLDVAAAQERGIAVCGTDGVGQPTVQIAIGLILELARHIGYENGRLKAGAPWQSTVGTDLEGKTIGLVGLGRLGARTAKAAQGLGMKAIAWSQNLTPEKCDAAGVGYATKDELFAQADVISLHLILSPRSRGIVGARELGLMKPTAYIVNTSRGPLIDEAALIDALQARNIAGAGLDVFDIEPMPADHPFRMLDNVVITPHLGYVTKENLGANYRGVVEDIRAFLDGAPIKLMDA